MKDKQRITAIILVAGNSTRFAQNRNKNFEILNGKIVLYYTLDAFNRNEYIDDIVIVARKDETNFVKEFISKQTDIKKNIYVISGGNSRQESVYNAITNTDAEIVIIQDGARPAIKQRYINECIESIGSINGVTVGVKSKDTIKVTDDNNIVINTTKRSNTWIIQTPQCFNRQVLLDMHEKYKNIECTDDCALLEKGGQKVKIIEGDYTNIKITTYEDMKVIKGLM